MLLKPDLDQHFLIDKKALQIILENSSFSKNDIVLEIGPGKGVLTKELVKNSRVIAVEKDTILFSDLKSKFKSKNLKLINANILEIIKDLEFNKIVSNIPYCISEPLLKKILIKQPKLVILCTGKSFIHYLEENSLFNKIYSFNVLEILSPDCFDPAPKTDSVILKMILKEDKEASFFRELFLQHDKKLKNALIHLLKGKLTKNQVRAFTDTLISRDKNTLLISEEDVSKLSPFIDNL